MGSINVWVLLRCVMATVAVFCLYPVVVVESIVYCRESREMTEWKKRQMKAAVRLAWITMRYARDVDEWKMLNQRASRQ